jgi:hypothetical protein
MKDVEILRDLIKGLEKNGIVVTSHIVESLFNETQYLNYKKGFDVYKETNKIDEILNYINIRFPKNQSKSHIKPLEFRIKSLKEQMQLISKEPNSFKFLPLILEARLDELETLLEYYNKK